MKTSFASALLGIAARARAGGGAGLARQDRQDHRAVRAGLDARHGGAADRRPAAAEARPDLRDREQAGRQRQSRHRCGRQGGARRLDHRRSSIGGPLAINTLLFSKLPYDPGKDIAPVTQLVTQPSALAVNASLGVNSVAELVALLKREPGKYNFGSIGNGSLSHLAMEAIALKSGAQMVHVPYPGSPQAMTAVIRGDVQMACLPAISVTPQVATGKVKILAVSTARRSALLPDIPTLKEAGIDVEADAWMGLIAPARTPDAVIAKIHREVVEAIKAPEAREKLATQLMEPIGNSPAEFRAVIDREIARWAPVIKAIDLKIN